MKFEQDILKAQIASQLSQEASIEGTDINILIKSFEENLLGSYDRDMFMKSWSGDLQKKFPNGGFKTINGAAVFINGGKVVAGLGGFNGMIDDYFSAKKEGGGKPKVEGSSKLDNTIKIMNSLVKNNGMPLKELYDKTIEGHGIRDGALIFSEFIKRKKDEGDKKIMDEFNKTSFTENVNPSKLKEEEKKDKPVNERTQQEIHEAKQKIADTMPKPINKMTWEEFKPYGIEMAKQAAHSQPESYYERMAKNEHNWAIKNDKSQYDVSEKQKEERKEEKAKLSPRAKQVLKESQRTFDSSNSLRQIELYDLVKKNIGIDKNGKEKIGMGLDEDMVAAGNEFLKKNEKAYNGAKELIQSRKDFKKEEGKTKATKDVSNIEKIALQQNKEMEDKIKSISSSASVKEKLEVIKQFSDKVKSIKDKSVYNSNTGETNLKVIDNLSDIVSHIDARVLGKEDQNELTQFTKDIDSIVSRSSWNNNKRYFVHNNDFKRELKSKEHLSDKLNFIKEEIEKEKKDSDYEEEEGTISRHDEILDDLNKFVQKISKEYISKNTTEVLNYKLF